MNFRPSTSPTPYSAPEMRRNGARFRNSKATCNSPVGLPAVPAAAAAFNKPLRPIGERGGGMFSMCVEGTKAGEEKAVGSIDKREATHVRPSAALETGINKDAAASRDNLRFKRLEQELSKAQDLLKKRTSERDNARSKNEEAQGLLGELNSRLAGSEKEHAAQICDKDALIAKLREQIAGLEKRLKDLEKTNSDLLMGKGGKASQLEADLAALQARMDRMLEEKDGTIGDLQSKESEMMKRIAELQSELRNSNAGSSAAEDRLRKELEERTRESAQWQEAAKKAQKELAEREGLFNQWKDTIDRVNKYIVKICQPQFSVVKDESLAPVTPSSDGSQQHEGFVLVPLSLMLEGYTILPPDTKKQIANEYETSKQRGLSSVSSSKNLSSQIPRRPSGGYAL